MNEEPSKGGSGRGCRTSGCLLASIGFLIFFFFLMMAGIGTGLVKLGAAMLFGWIGFISRVAPRITWNWGAIVTGIVFTYIFILVIHRFLAWLTRAIAVARGASFRWQWKWSLCGCLLLALCFLVALSVAGVAHQIGWIMGGRKSLFEDRYAMRRYAEMNAVEMAVREALVNASTLQDLRKNVPATLKKYRGELQPSPLESVRLLVSLTSSNTVSGVLMLARDKKSETRYGARYVTPSDSSPVLPNDVPSLIRSNATNLVAF